MTSFSFDIAPLVLFHQDIIGRRWCLILCRFPWVAMIENGLWIKKKEEKADAKLYSACQVAGWLLIFASWSFTTFFLAFSFAGCLFCQAGKRLPPAPPPFQSAFREFFRGVFYLRLCYMCFDQDFTQKWSLFHPTSRILNSSLLFKKETLASALSQNGRIEV